VNRKIELKPGGEGKDLTIMFTDIRGFTTLSENMSPEETVELINEYFGIMVEVVFRYGGTLDKFIGDAIMAFWGAPVGHGDDPVRAVRTAIEMMDILGQLNVLRQGRGEPDIKIGIGTNTGDVVAGYLGSSKALEYTVIGDTVNTGARLCSLAKAGEIIISHNTYERCGDLFEVVPAIVAELNRTHSRFETHEDAFEHGLRELVTALQRTSRVVYVRELPKFQTTPSCFLRRVRLPGRQCSPSIQRRAVEASMAAYDRIVDEVRVAFPQLRVVDSIAALCDAAVCSQRLQSGEILYSDRFHLSPAGGRHFARSSGLLAVMDIAPIDHRVDAHRVHSN
jgi:class 3 adenylate cyclase